jgi:hypothetical protein
MTHDLDLKKSSDEDNNKDPYYENGNKILFVGNYIFSFKH